MWERKQQHARGGGGGATRGRGIDARFNNQRSWLMGNKQRPHRGVVKLSATTPHDWHVAPQQKKKKSHLLTTLCLDVCVEVYSFLDAKEHAACRLVCKFFCALFDHAFQRGYVACAIFCAYVDDVKTFYGDGDPLRVAPVDRKNMFAANAAFFSSSYKMQRSENDGNATLIVNVAKMLGKGETRLQDRFLFRAQFKAVHLIETEWLEKIGDCCLDRAQNLVCFTMSTPCPKLKSVKHSWLFCCSALKFITFEGCTALASVGSYWLFNCKSLKIASFNKCSALEEVGDDWLGKCVALETVDIGACASLQKVGRRWLTDCPVIHRVLLPGDHQLPGDITQIVKKYLHEEEKK